MNKKRILMCAEASHINSGFGRYTLEILKRLYARKDYEIAEFASYAVDGAKRNVPWKVYPNAVTDEHKDATLYKSNPINQFGQWRFEKVVLHFKPDIVFDIRDYWMFSYQEVSPLKPYYHWVIAPTIDSIPQRQEWLTTFENADLVLTHTDWALNYLKSLNRPIKTGISVSDSVDPNVFKPISWTKRFHKTQFGINPEYFVIGSVMRNQKRKLIAELFSSLKSLIEKTKNTKIYLYLHTSYPEANGWNIPELLQEYGVYNNVLFTYYAPHNQKIYVSPFRGAKIKCPDDANHFAIFPNVINGVSNEQLSQIYNTFDIYVQYAICEGLGIPQLEAASCGIPVFAVNYSGMEELTTKLNGVKIDNVLAKELETSSDRAVPINDDFVNKVIDWMNTDEAYKQNKSKETRKLLVDNYSWDKTAENLMNVFDGLAPKNKWDQPMIVNPSQPVPQNLSNRQFVNFIIDNILMSPELKKTYFIQNLIKSLDEKLITSENSPSNIKERNNIIKNLEIYLNNKIYCEQVRSGKASLAENSFLYE